VRAYPSVELLHAEAGWSAILRVPSIHGEENLAIELIERDGVVVHPGYFFDMPHEAFLVVSLLPEPGVFDDGVGRLLERAGA
jgi:aspartate/methionine/tyrosine aminotransferase